MKTLKLNQMEDVNGGGHCDAAEFWKWLAPVSSAYSAIYIYEALACAINGNGNTF